MSLVFVVWTYKCTDAVQCVSVYGYIPTQQPSLFKKIPSCIKLYNGWPKDFCLEQLLFSKSNWNLNVVPPSNRNGGFLCVNKR